MPRQTAKQIALDTANFDGALSGADTDVQKAFETLDDAAGGGADVFSAYDAAGGTVLGTGVGGNPTAFVVLPLDTEHQKTSGFTHAASSAEVTINAAGKYVVNGSIGNNVTSGTDRSASEGRLMLDTGGGFVEVGGTRTENYNRNTIAGGNDGSFEVILDLEVGDVLRMEGRRLAGNNTVVLKADGTALNIYAAGVQGAKGNPGATSSVLTLLTSLYADQLDTPNTADWVISVSADSAPDSLNDALPVRLFDASVEEGVGFLLRPPDSTGSLTLKFQSRAQLTGGGNVVYRIYTREIQDGAAVSAWSAAFDLSVFAFVANTSWQENTEVVTMAALGLTAGKLYQFEITRKVTGVASPLAGDVALLALEIRGDQVQTFQNSNFFADQLQNSVTADWAVNGNAPEGADSINSGLKHRAHEKASEKGSGGMIRVPVEAANVTIRYHSRSQDGGGGNVIPKFYARRIVAGGSPGAWQSVVLSALVFGANTNWERDEQTLTLAAANLTAGDLYQFQETRDVAGADTLAGDWNMLEFGLEWS